MPLKRRTFILGTVSALGCPALLRGVRASEGVAYVSPDGDGTGASKNAPAPIQALPDLIRQLSPGGTIYLLAGQGKYFVEEAIDIDIGGTEEAPVSIVGLDDGGGRGLLEGGRIPWSVPSGIEQAVDASEFGGNTLFRIVENASFLRFASFDVQHVGRVVDLAAQRSRGITVEDIRFLNVRDGIFTDRNSECTDVVIRQFSGRGFSKKAIRFHGTCNNWLIEDCELDSGWQYGDQFAVGIEAHHDAHGLTIRGGYTINSMDIRGGDDQSYWNADGVASERGNYDILIVDHWSAGHTDSAYDLKSENTRLINCVAEDSKRNYRLWGGIGTQPMILENCSSINPFKRGGSGGTHHIWLDGAREEGGRAASIVYVGGIIGGEIERPILADGGNIAVHLVDTTVTDMPDGVEIFHAGRETSVMVAGTASAQGVSAISTEDSLTVVANSAKTVMLEADGAASWRLAEASDDLTAYVDGNFLTVSARAKDLNGTVTVQARDERGAAIQKIIAVETIENPVAPGVAFSLVVADGRLADATGLHTIIASERAVIDGDVFVFDGRRSFFEVEASAGLLLNGQFYVRAEMELDETIYFSPPDLITRWKTSGHQRSFRIGLDEEGHICFYWSSSGRLQEENILVGPEVRKGHRFTVEVMRDEDDRLLLSVDGAVVASTANGVDELFGGDAPLRVSGRPDGERGALGRLHSLTIGRPE